MIEQDTRYIIDSNLSNKGWILDISNPNKNVFFETDINRILDNPRLRKSKLKPDYVLVDNNKKPIGVIEAKAGGKNLDIALEQATEYADILQAPLIFAMNNSYCQTKHLYTNKPLFINDNEVNELIKQTEAIKFLHEKSNIIYTVPKDIILSRQDLISIFKQINSKLRQLGFQAGYERLSEFANLLFLKLYSENTNEEIWSDIKNAGNTAIVGTVNNSLKLIEQQYNIDGAIFKDTSITSPQALKDIISKLDKLHFSTIDTDIKGDAFEYFIQKTPSADKDLGEYFTPRHVIKTVVNIVKPKFKETVYDPFCGSGGFLTESFSYVKENTIINNLDDRKILSEKSFFGGEISNTARLAKMNMILHGDGHSGIKQIDSINNPVQNKYDIVITNIPFGLKELGEFSHLYNNGLAKNYGEGICLLHCFNAVKQGGRMAIIVPEGALFRSLEETRKHLLDNAKLVAVISLPSGTFLPYTNAKTNILYFTDCHINKTNKVWFFNVNNDGFSLNTARRPIKENDLRKVDFVNFNLKDEEIKDLGFYSVSIEDIRNNKYNLIGSQYIERKESYRSSEFLSLGDLCDSKTGYAFKSNNFTDMPKDSYLPVLKIKNIGLKGNIIRENIQYHYNEARYNSYEINKDDVVIAMTGDNKEGASTIGKVALVDDKWLLNQRVMKVKHKNDITNKYIFYCLLSNKFKEYCRAYSNKTAQANISENVIKEFLIPLPSLKEQEEIVKQLEEIDNSIKYSKNLIKSLKAGWRYFSLYGQTKSSVMKVSEISVLIKGATPKYGNSNTIVIKSGQARGYDGIKLDTLYYLEQDKIDNKLLKKGDILVNTTGVGTAGRITYFDLEGVYVTDSHITTIRVHNNINSKYVYLALSSIYSSKELEKLCTGSTGQIELNKSTILNLCLPIPSIEIQEEIIKQYDEEIHYIKMTEEMIDRQKEKIEMKLKEIWIQNKDKLKGEPIEG